MIDIARESSYSTPFATSPLLPLLLMSLSSQKNSPTPTQTPSSIHSEYDYIIVGAGSAGATVAGRLSELACVSVLLLEAGIGPPLLNDIPFLGLYFWDTNLDWAYKTVPQEHAGLNAKNRQLTWPSGKGLGGSSLLNSEINVRGNRKNYDDWAAQGATGWSFKDVLPYFKKLENETDPEYLKNGYHGTTGPVTIESIRYHPPLKHHIFKAFNELKYKIVDINGPRQTGVYAVQGNLRNGQRCSTGKAYLVPAENRTNLHILPNAFVHKVIIKNNRAVGVSFDINNTVYEVKAKKEVIVSAGTINTAQILMLSGIGPKEELEKHSIPVVANLPVGENLQDHQSAVLGFELSNTITPTNKIAFNNQSIQEYIDYRRGPLANLETVDAVAFLRNGYIWPPFDFPNYELYLLDVGVAFPKMLGVTQEAYNQVYRPYEDKPTYFCNSQILQPKSRGNVKLQSSDPHEPPLIDPKYYSNPEDLIDSIEGLKTCMKISSSRAMQEIGSKPFNKSFPGCEKFTPFTDNYYKCLSQSISFSQSHEVGTAKMGHPNDPTAVVDPELRVKGITGLRVVDASVMPIVPSGNTNIPTIMVAEKASDIIKGDIRCFQTRN